MTLTVSDVVPAAEAAAEGGGSPPAVTDSPVSVRTRGPDGPAIARARIPVTQSVGKTFAFDVSKAWVWRVAPPTLKQVKDGVVPDPDLVPAGAPPLRAGWVVWNVAVAVPATAVLYVLAWLLQHPGRAMVLAVLAGPLGFFWLTK